MIRDDQALTRMGCPKGQPNILPPFGKHWGGKILGTLDDGTGEVFCLLNDHDDAPGFLEFLEQTVARYPGEKIVMILDHAKIHHAKLIPPFLAEHRDDVTLVFLPPYSPPMHRIEAFWGWLKRSVIDHVCFHSVAAIRLAVQAFIAMVNATPANTRERLCMG